MIKQLSDEEAPEVTSAPALARAFAEHLVARALASRPTGDAASAVARWRWEDAWTSAAGGGSVERAIGRALLDVAALVGRVPAAPKVDAVAGTAPVPAVRPAAAPPAPAVATSPAPAVAVLAEPLVAAVAERGAPPPARATGRNRLLAVFTWVRNVGAVVVLFAGWQVWGTNIEHAHAQSSLRSQFAARASHATTPPSGPVLAPVTAQLPAPGEGAVVARLQIPAIGVDQFVVQGTAASDLDKGPGHYVGTALPGQQGNVAIAAHRTTYGAPFNRLDQLAVGDPITLTTASGERLSYIVSSAPVAVSPGAVSVLNDFGDDRITLTTCNPKFSASQRLVVVATFHSPTVPARHHPRRSLHVMAGSSGWNITYLPAVLALVGALVALGLLHQRITRHLRQTRWLALSPIWAAGIFLLFVALSGLLPATL